MHGGGYANFLAQIKKESKTNCLAKFIIVDADRLKKHTGEKEGFLKLVDYCRLQNHKGVVPHFLIVDNPDFEYVACLHVPEYTGQDVTRFIQTKFNFQTLDQFKRYPKVYDVLNDGECSHKVLLDRIRGKEKFVQNSYSIKKKSFDISISKTDVIWDLADRRGSNIEEFFDVIDW